MKLSTAIKLGRSRKEIAVSEPTQGGYFQYKKGKLSIDTLAAAHLGVYRNPGLFRGDPQPVADTVTFEVIDAFPMLGERVKYHGVVLAKELRAAGLPFSSREQSLFSAITELDALGKAALTADILERCGL